MRYMVYDRSVIAISLPNFNDILPIKHNILVMRIPKLDPVRFLPQGPLAALESLDEIFDSVSLFPANYRHDPFQRAKEIR